MVFICLCDNDVFFIYMLCGSMRYVPCVHIREHYVRLRSGLDFEFIITKGWQNMYTQTHTYHVLFSAVCTSQVQDQPNLCKSIQHICILPSCLLLSSYPRVSYHHGSLSPGAVYQLHDRLNHCAADVAAGENLPRLNHGARREEMTEVPEESERYEENQHCYCRTLLLSDSCSDSVYILSFF